MDLFQKFYDRALRFLSYRPRSEKEIIDFLQKKKVNSSTINKVLTKLKQLNFINDQEFTKWWVEQRTTFRPEGVRLIKLELRQKGISPELIEKIISNDQFLISNEKAIKKLIIKKITNYKGLPKRELYQKLSQFLLRRGFNWDAVKNAVDDSLRK